jgi:AcrR family transcriptional regulator
MNSTAPSETGFADKTSTEQKLLQAAREVLARDGVSGATTREIARVAGVNEVTLFRKFQTKQGLLTAVLEDAFLPAADSGPWPSLQNGSTLQEVVSHFAAVDFERKRRNISFMRVLVGESHRLGEHETEILRRIFLPWKEELAAQFAEAQRRGLVCADMNPVIIVDQLVAMIFVGALRADMTCKIDYSPETWLAACVDLVLRAVAVPGGGSGS